MGQSETKERDTDIVLPAELLPDARKLLDFFTSQNLRLVDPEGKAKRSGTGFKWSNVQSPEAELDDDKDKGHFYKSQGPTSSHDLQVSQAISFILEHCTLIGAKKLWSTEEFVEQVVKPDPLPVFCAECGGDFDLSSPNTLEFGNMRAAALPEDKRILSFSCGNHHVHTSCTLLYTFSNQSKTYRNRQTDTVSISVTLPFDKCDDRNKFPVECRCGVCHWGETFSDPNLARFLLRPSVSGSIILSPLFRASDLKYISPMLKYGDLIDVSGYRFSEMYIVAEDGSAERVDWDDSSYGRIPWEYYKKLGLLYYLNYCSGNYESRFGSMPIGNGLYTQNDSIVDLLTTPEEKGRISTQPLLEWLFTSEEPGSLRAEYEGAESILEKLNADRKAVAERNNTWSTGGSGAEKPVPPTAPVVKSLSYKHKNGTWTPVPIVRRRVTLPTWALYAKRPYYFEWVSKFLQLEIKFKVDFSPCPCEFVGFSSSISEFANVSSSCGVMHSYASSVPPLKNIIRSMIGNQMWNDQTGASCADWLKRIAAHPKADEVREVLIAKNQKCNICGFKVQEKEFTTVPKRGF